VKTCKCCKEEKPYEAFAKCSARLDGHLHKCKACVAATRPSRAGSSVSKAQWDRWYAANRETLLAKQKESEARRDYLRKRYSVKRDAIRSQQKVYRNTSEAKALHAAVQRKRNQRVADATPAWLSADQRAAIDYVYWHARDVTRVTGEPYHVDHIVPLRGRKVCGLHVPWNLRVVPADINLRKHISLEGY
jgi:hypothetical protein